MSRENDNTDDHISLKSDVRVEQRFGKIDPGGTAPEKDEP
jgi:hypothetical protein